VRERAAVLLALPLPTYAPWTTRIETVWGKLYQEILEILHLHPWVDAWDQLQAAVQAWLAHYVAPSDAVLRDGGSWCPP
jgi:hypothetical protein